MKGQIIFKSDEETIKLIKEGAAANFESVSAFVRRAAILRAKVLLNRSTEVLDTSSL